MGWRVASHVYVFMVCVPAVITVLSLQVWRDCLETKATSPYLTHMLPLGGIQSLRFCPYEDVLGVGCAGGISSVLIPGAGEPNFDSFVANPFQGKKERQEQEVVQLLDKLQPETIMLDPAAVGKVRRECGCCRGLRAGVIVCGARGATGVMNPGKPCQGCGTTWAPVQHLAVHTEPDRFAAIWELVTVGCIGGCSDHRTVLCQVAVLVCVCHTKGVLRRGSTIVRVICFVLSKCLCGCVCTACDGVHV
jgi:hypothetical protein